MAEEVAPKAPARLENRSFFGAASVAVVAVEAGCEEVGPRDGKLNAELDVDADVCAALGAAGNKEPGA